MPLQEDGDPFLDGDSASTEVVEGGVPYLFHYDQTSHNRVPRNASQQERLQRLEAENQRVTHIIDGFFDEPWRLKLSPRELSDWIRIRGQGVLKFMKSTLKPNNHMLWRGARADPTWIRHHLILIFWPHKKHDRKLSEIYWQWRDLDPDCPYPHGSRWIPDAGVWESPIRGVGPVRGPPPIAPSSIAQITQTLQTATLAHTAPAVHSDPSTRPHQAVQATPSEALILPTTAPSTRTASPGTPTSPTEPVPSLPAKRPVTAIEGDIPEGTEKRRQICDDNGTTQPVDGKQDLMTAQLIQDCRDLDRKMKKLAEANRDLQLKIKKQERDHTDYRQKLEKEIQDLRAAIEDQKQQSRKTNEKLQELALAEHRRAEPRIGPLRDELAQMEEGAQTSEQDPF